MKFVRNMANIEWRLRRGLKVKDNTWLNISQERNYDLLYMKMNHSSHVDQACGRKFVQKFSSLM